MQTTRTQTTRWGQSDAYFNRRAECWAKMAEWLRAGAEIPDDPELEVDLCGLQYGYSSKSQIQLERKEDMKARGQSSPDLGDMLSMSFSVNVRVNRQVAEWWEQFRNLNWTPMTGRDGWMA